MQMDFWLSSDAIMGFPCQAGPLRLEPIGPFWKRKKTVLLWWKVISRWVNCFPCSTTFQLVTLVLASPHPNKKAAFLIHCIAVSDTKEKLSQLMEHRVCAETSIPNETWAVLGGASPQMPALMCLVCALRENENTHRAPNTHLEDRVRRVSPH